MLDQESEASMGRSIGRKAHVRILPMGEVIVAETGASIFGLLGRIGVDTGGVCGGVGVCHKCLVRFMNEVPEPCGEETAHIPESLLQQGWRLACRHVVRGDTTIHVPMASHAVQHASPRLSPESSVRLEQLRTQALEGSCQLSTGAPHWLGSGSAPPLPAPSNSRQVGLALDIGTTSIVGRLVDVRSKRVLADATALNPQSRHGADVITRIHFVQDDAERNTREMHDLVHQGIAAVVDRLENCTDVDRSEITHIVVVGNPTMLHLFLDICPQSLGHSPYEPVFSDRVVLTAKEARLDVRPDARVDLLPGISGFVGADVVAGILAIQLGCRRSVPELLLDLGTNGELALWTGDEILTTSTAAGPAFEAASISCGMRAVDGAINRLWVHDGELAHSVIGDETPRGLCGSGLVSAVAACRRLGLINPRGRIVRAVEDHSERIAGSGLDARIVLVNDEVLLTQNDIHELQLAKGAIRAGMDIVLVRAGLLVEDLKRITVAGALGAGLDPADLFEIGLLPASGKHVEIVTPGNTACAGAVDSVVAPHLLEQADRIAREARTVKLSTDAAFRSAFARHMMLCRQ